MHIKERFITYVEMQKGANHARHAYGPDDIRTVEAYQKANELKREVMNSIEELEHRIKSLDK